VLTVVATLMPPVDVIAATALGMLVELYVTPEPGEAMYPVTSTNRPSAERVRPPWEFIVY